MADRGVNQAQRAEAFSLMNHPSARVSAIVGPERRSSKRDASVARCAPEISNPAGSIASCNPHRLDP